MSVTGTATATESESRVRDRGKLRPDCLLPLPQFSLSGSHNASLLSYAGSFSQSDLGASMARASPPSDPT
jgi:hypothetical protein